MFGFSCQILSICSSPAWTSRACRIAAHLEVVKLLLGRGADVHVLNDEGQTPHQLSIQSGQYWIADILKEHGSGEEKNAQGSTKMF